jgi:hypothetical protein
MWRNWNQGRLEEAEGLEAQVVEARKRVLVAEHPGTLAGMNNLAFTWKGRGRHKEAVALMEECIELEERVLGADHPSTLSSRMALARWKRGTQIC